jgi:hypothetical protein
MARRHVNLVIQFQWALLHFCSVAKTEDERVSVLRNSYAWADAIKLSRMQLCLQGHFACPCVCLTVRPSINNIHNQLDATILVYY